MHLERNDAMSRLLDRHPTIEHVPGSSGQGTLIRRDQLLVSGRDASAVEERASRWFDSREDDAETGVAILRLRPGVDVCDLAANLSGAAAHRTLNAGPNHVLTAAPNWEPGPADEPVPADAVASTALSVRGPDSPHHGGDPRHRHLAAPVVHGPELVQRLRP